jgi:hypothetical protein
VGTVASLKPPGTAPDAKMDMRRPASTEIHQLESLPTPVAAGAPRTAMRGLMLFVAGLVTGVSAAALLVTYWLPAHDRDIRDRALTRARPSASPATIDVPPEPRIRPAHNPSEVPAGPKVNPLEPKDLYELRGEPGHFTHEGVSFEYPPWWEMVATNGYRGLAGNFLWMVPIGIDEVDHVRIAAIYFPWEYSDQQMHEVAENAVDYMVTSNPGWRILRPPSPVRTGGVTVYWSDMAGKEVSGVDVVTRMYVFAWNDVEYYFGCQEAVGSQAGIIRGCDQIFSTLRLGIPTV